MLNTGIQAPQNPRLGGWGGRLTQVTTSPNLWRLVPTEKDASGADVANYTTLRWAAAAQNDFAARIQWTLTPEYRAANHPPPVSDRAGDRVRARPGASVTLAARTSDPDRDRVTTSWWQYREEGTYPGAVTVTATAAAGRPSRCRPTPSRARPSRSSCRAPTTAGSR